MIKHTYLLPGFLKASYMLLSSFNTSLIKTNSSWQIFDSIKALESETSMVFNLVFAKNTTLPCFLLFLLIIDLNFLVPAVIT